MSLQIKLEDCTCVSLYVPPRRDLDDVIMQLKQEMDVMQTAKEPTRSRILETLSRIQIFIRSCLEDGTGDPTNGFIIFCAPNQPLHFIDPIEPVQINLYRCDDHFATDYLKSG